MILEDQSVVQYMKKSGHLFKKTWGENVTGGVAMAAFFVILGAIGIIPLVISLVVGSFVIPVVSVVVVYWIILVIIYSGLQGIFVTALYNYANSGKLPSIYRPEVIEKAFRPRAYGNI